MKKLALVVALCIYSFQMTAQKLGWQVNSLGFADNREYKSSVQIPQTMFGMWVAPQLVIEFDTLHTFHGGVNALKEFGGHNIIDQFSPYLYYGFRGEFFKFNFGVFPRKDFLDKAPKILFNDSLTYYRPYISGLFWTYNKGNYSQSVFLDWTSRQTEVHREAFIMGGKGSYRMGAWFFDHYLYMYHYAHSIIKQEGDFIHDNGVVMLTLGGDFHKNTILDTLKLSVSGVKSFERNRGEGAWNLPQGLIFDVSLGFKSFGIRNSFYFGEGHNLYWGDPFYKLKRYNRTDFSYMLLNYHRVTGLFVYSIHYAEEKISHQQQFYLSVNLSSKK